MAKVWGRSMKEWSPSSYMMMGQYWLGTTKLKEAFRLTQNAFKKLLLNIRDDLFFTD